MVRKPWFATNPLHRLRTKPTNPLLRYPSQPNPNPERALRLHRIALWASVIRNRNHGEPWNKPKAGFGLLPVLLLLKYVREGASYLIRGNAQFVATPIESLREDAPRPASLPSLKKQKRLPTKDP